MTIDAIKAGARVVAALAVAVVSSISVACRTEVPSHGMPLLSAFETTSVAVAGDVRTSDGSMYTGPMTLRFEHHADGGTYSTSEEVLVTKGSLDATAELAAVRSGTRVTVEAWEGSHSYDREDAVFYSDSEGRGFVRVASLRDRNGGLVLPLSTCFISRPPFVAAVDVGEPNEAGDVEVIVHPGDVERHTLTLSGRALAVTAPTSVHAYSWNPTDVWTAAVVANERMTEPVQFTREGHVTIALPKYAAVDGTYSLAAYPDLLHIVFFPTSQYSPFQPQKPAGYERYQENYNRINKHRWASIDWVSGTFELLDLLPETSYTIEFWDAASHDAGTPLVVTTVTLGAANSVTALAVN